MQTLHQFRTRLVDGRTTLRLCFSQKVSDKAQHLIAFIFWDHAAADTVGPGESRARLTFLANLQQVAGLLALLQQQQSGVFLRYEPSKTMSFQVTEEGAVLTGELGEGDARRAVDVALDRGDIVVLQALLQHLVPRLAEWDVATWPRKAAS
eukprot:EG_transcript_25797